MCVRARFLTPLHEDEMWMIQANAFLSPVPLVVGPSAESRGHDSTRGGTLFAVARHRLQSEMPCRKKCTTKVKLHDVTVDTIVVVVDDQPVLTAMRKSVDSFDTTFTEIPFGNSACGVKIFVLAASASPPANVKPTSVVSIVVSSY